jgi:hypothetical protein
MALNNYVLVYSNKINISFNNKIILVYFLFCIYQLLVTYKKENKTHLTIGDRFIIICSFFFLYVHIYLFLFLLILLTYICVLNNHNQTKKYYQHLFAWILLNLFLFLLCNDFEWKIMAHISLYMHTSNKYHSSTL